MQAEAHLRGPPNLALRTALRLGVSFREPQKPHPSIRSCLFQTLKMADPVNGAANPTEEDELVDYEEDQPEETAQAKGTETVAKKGYVGIHSTGFKDFLLKPELLRAIVDCGFEHPSEGLAARTAAFCRCATCLIVAHGDVSKIYKLSATLCACSSA